MVCTRCVLLKRVGRCSVGHALTGCFVFTLVYVYLHIYTMDISNIVLALKDHLLDLKKQNICVVLFYNRAYRKHS